MSRMLRDFLVCSQWLLVAVGEWTRQTRDMKGQRTEKKSDANDEAYAVSEIVAELTKCIEHEAAKAAGLPAGSDRTNIIAALRPRHEEVQERLGAGKSLDAADIHIGDAMRSISRPANSIVDEATRSYRRVRLTPPPDMPPVPKAAELRRLGKMLSSNEALRAMAGVQEWQAAVWSRVFQEPPETADMFKHRCAAEAFDLVEALTPKQPTGAADGPFHTIAVLLYGDPDANLKRACDRVLKLRRKYRTG
jgi:hypothetical protein